MTENAKNTWDELQAAVLSGVLPNHGGDLLPDDLSDADRIILLEMARDTSVTHGIPLTALAGRQDFAEWVGERRPDTTVDQWLWLYRKIGVRRPNLSVDEIVGIMAGRDALLPFLRTAPDLRLVECYEKFLEDDVEDEAVEEGEEDPNELPYPLLEDAVRNDDPAKLTIFLAICRAVSVEQILPRAVSLEKPAVTCKLLESLPSEQHVPGLVRALRRWGRPEELLRRAVESFEDELAAWHDDYGNGFFWYLYARNQPVSEAMIDALPEKVITTWEHPNRYGIAPADLWRYYRTALQLPMKKPRARV